ncbi:hypothetical protein ACFVWL_06355 [Microbacterium sp. NPDC058269]|uniref:hypothetical protein n=1 Tax=Microbacterium sp. NPDC058269 TaxID=3346414 RepID=UPI0036D9B3ED
MLAERSMIRGDSMNTRIHVDFATIRASASSLHGLAVGSTNTSGLDLSALGSDLVASAAEAFAGGWSDALGLLTLTSSGLAGGVDATLADFVTEEQAHLDSLATSIGELER